MDMIEFNEACKRLAMAWRAFGISVSEAIDAFTEVFSDAIEETTNVIEDFLGYLRKEAKESKKPDGIPIPPRKYHKKDYLHNQNISAYRVDKKVQKNLPYQRRNY
ncbi:hypothetical protein [Bacteroides acidifaciens]|uniref:hypothetical protein n=1 Tax=Bacteroides acidifaciens TaxID=85831 RepID=UPI0025B59762|nr:hypothetical protein [Bacteroides acidifaciens]